ncbi:MAG: hypothetical protein QGF67_04655 [Lentisphaeria bacterium]|jgi:hypothetical protein|nr:hypothetical protein [Lentisphaeria bacterium]
MLGMYIHTHWSYRHPYAARTWTVADWAGFLGALQALGYDLVKIWPLLDAMPPEPNASDRAFLDTLSQVIDIAHERFGMRVWIVVCPNTIGNDKAADYPHAERPYFICEQRINPADPAAVAAFMAGRRNQLSRLANADGLVIIDSDPGGYIGSTNRDFVALIQGQIEIMRSFNPAAEFVYWMFAGWERYCRFWQKARDDDEGRTSWWGDDWQGNEFIEPLQLISQTIPEPWRVLAWFDEHRDALTTLQLTEKAAYYPYGAIEGEPSFPLTLWSPEVVADACLPDKGGWCPHGIMANAQTHCLQLPHIYAFAHFAQGGGPDRLDLAGFAERLLPGHGDAIASAWTALGDDTAAGQQGSARRLRELVGQPHAPGDLDGLLFGDADRFLTDLAMNLEVQAALLELGAAFKNGKPVPALQQLLAVFRPYQSCLGFEDAYGGDLAEALNHPLRQLDEAALNAVLGDFSQWRDPTVRHGIVSRLLDAIEGYCERNG